MPFHELLKQEKHINEFLRRLKIPLTTLDLTSRKYANLYENKQIENILRKLKNKMELGNVKNPSAWFISKIKIQYPLDSRSQTIHVKQREVN